MNSLVPSAILIAADNTGIGSGRLVPTVAAVVGLVGVVLSALALSRSFVGARRLGAIAAVVAGLISAAVGGLHAANSAGGFGTGNGLAGAIVAIVVGLIGVVLGALALARSGLADLSQARNSLQSGGGGIGARSISEGER